MDTNSIIPHLDITVNDKDIETGALEILKNIRPTWNVNEIELKLLTDGITNKLVGCKAKDVDEEDTVLVRVYGNKTDLMIDRKAETRNIFLLSKLGLAPSLYATFENGLAYQFIPGDTLNDETTRQKKIYELVATRMAKLHKIQVPGEPNPKPFIWSKIEKFFNLVPNTFTRKTVQKRFEETIVPKTEIRDEIHRLMEFFEKSNSPIVFCHNDLLLANVIYTREKHFVTFIDFEYAAFNYQAFDIANHFLEFAGVDEVDYSKYPNKELQIDWIENYLREFKGDFSKDDVEGVFKEVNRFTLISHIFWGLWALIQAEHSYINFDFIGYAAIRFNEYFARKKDIIGEFLKDNK